MLYYRNNTYLCSVFRKQLIITKAMGSKNGQSNNPNGRPKGTQNKVTTELKERVRFFIENNLDTIEADFKKLEPRERVQAFTALLKFAIPSKVEQNNLNADSVKETINIMIDGKKIDLS